MAQESEQGYGFISIYMVFLVFIVNNLSNLLGNIGVTQLGVAGQTQSLPETFQEPGKMVQEDQRSLTLLRNK